MNSKRLIKYPIFIERMLKLKEFDIFLKFKIDGNHFCKIIHYYSVETNKVSIFIFIFIFMFII